MVIISLNRFINKGDLDSAYRRIPFLLTQALALHAIDCDPSEREQFQITIRKLQQDLEEASDPQSALVTTGEIISTLNNYNRTVERLGHYRIHELHSIITLLANKVMGTADSSDISCRKLADVEQRLKTASQVEDIRALRVKLQEALVGIQQEATRQATQSQTLRTEAETLQRSAHAFTFAPPPGGVDLVTGLPSRVVGEIKLQSAVAGESPHTFAAMFSIQRLSTINQRFGFNAGDNLLMLYAQHLAQHLGAADELFRWRGPTFLALLTRGRGGSAVATELNRICSARFEYNATLDKKAVLIPISAAFLVIDFREHSDVGEIIGILDRFASDQGAAEAAVRRMDGDAPGGYQSRVG